MTCFPRTNISKLRQNPSFKNSIRMAAWCWLSWPCLAKPGHLVALSLMPSDLYAKSHFPEQNRNQITGELSLPVAPNLFYPALSPESQLHFKPTFHDVSGPVRYFLAASRLDFSALSVSFTDILFPLHPLFRAVACACVGDGAASC